MPLNQPIQFAVNGPIFKKYVAIEQKTFWILSYSEVVDYIWLFLKIGQKFIKIFKSFSNKSRFFINHLEADFIY